MHVQVGINLGTLNRAGMLEHRIQHLTEMPKICWNIVSNNTNMDICFSNNPANTNTQQYILASYVKRLHRVCKKLSGMSTTCRNPACA